MCRSAGLAHAGGAAAGGGASGLIALAQRLHDEHLAEGERTRDKLIGDAEKKAQEIVGDAVDPAALPSSLRTTLGAVLREAVTNVVRHSGAAQCRMWIGDEKLCICDDGSGLGDAVWGNGLTGMRRRVDAAGGELTVGPGPDGHGTCVGVIG